MKNRRNHLSMRTSTFFYRYSLKFEILSSFPIIFRFIPVLFGQKIAEKHVLHAHRKTLDEMLHLFLNALLHDSMGKNISEMNVGSFLCSCVGFATSIFKSNKNMELDAKLFENKISKIFNDCSPKIVVYSIQIRSLLKTTCTKSILKRDWLARFQALQLAFSGKISEVCYAIAESLLIKMNGKGSDEGIIWQAQKYLSIAECLDIHDSLKEKIGELREKCSENRWFNFYDFQ